MPSLGDIFTPQVRQYLYVVVTAAVPLLIIYGILDAEQAAVWLALAAAALGTGTAAVNVAKQRKSGVLPGKGDPGDASPEG